MSHFLCGEIIFSDIEDLEHTEFTDLLLRLISAGAKRRLYVQFGPNISQKIVFDILRLEHNRIPINPLSFLLLGSPIENTSDEIFYPFSSHYSPDERLEHLETRIEDIGAWTNAVFDEDKAVGMSIYLSAGFDTNYDQKTCSLNEFPTILRQILSPLDDVPSTRILIEPDTQ